MKYQVNGYMTISCYCEVEAESEQEALEKAKRLPVASVPRFSCEPSEEWHFDSDGEPNDIYIDK